ncbi:hypothetical protein [Rhizobium sp. LC145]|uniref:hypothetical protein n=1 Tax=Rhizobium sp. LC145 TaxID=1120688 RepID=UPI000ABC0A07
MSGMTERPRKPPFQAAAQRNRSAAPEARGAAWSFDNDPDEMFRDACQSGLEGIIGKHRDPRIDPDKPATG